MTLRLFISPLATVSTRFLFSEIITTIHDVLIPVHFLRCYRMSSSNSRLLSLFARFVSAPSDWSAVTQRHRLTTLLTSTKPFSMPTDPNQS
jgi:hypothetical protein